MSELKNIIQPTNDLPIYELMNEAGIQKIHQTSIKILQEIGMAFYDEAARSLMKSKGAKVEGEIVFLDADLIQEYVSKSPPVFTQISRNPEKALKIGGNGVTFAPVYGPPFVFDLEGGRRSGTIEDFQNFVKLAYLSPYIHHSGGTIVEPNDCPVESRHLDMLMAHILFSDKPFMGSVTSAENARDSVALVKLLLGEETIQKNPALMSLVNVNSPRQFDETMTGALRVYAENRQAVVITPFIMSGTMAPITIAGALTQQNAEALAGIVYAQMINPGTPVVYGSYLTTVDMKSGAPVFGSPESQVALFASAQMARFYNLPFRSGGMYTTSKVTDAQAAFEAMMTMIPTVLARVNFVLHAAGWLESGMVAGYEKFILDCDILGMMHKFYQGLDLSDEQLAMDAIQDVEPGGHFLGTDHTMRHYKSAFYRSDLMDYTDYDQWVSKGSKDSLQLAHEQYKHLLDTYEPPTLDEGKKEMLEEYVAKRKMELEGN
jgi:trimethylamine--corrinoid protein Co-methyltransferase